MIREVRILKNNGIVNPWWTYRAARREGIPLHVAAAILEVESFGGKNIYGGDAGGALSRYPNPVDESNFEVHQWLVFELGQKSNGVGPCQITWPPFFDMAKEDGFRLWHPFDNMRFGFGQLADMRKRRGSWKEAITKEWNTNDWYWDRFGPAWKRWRERLSAG